MSSFREVREIRQVPPSPKDAGHHHFDFLCLPPPLTDHTERGERAGKCQRVEDNVSRPLSDEVSWIQVLISRKN